MRKKAKIIGTLFSFCISLAMLTIGVLAATNISFNVNSSVKFEATGVYVMVKGEILTGIDTNEESLNRPELVPEGSNYDYVGYSYTPISNDGTNDFPDGTSSFQTMSSWNVGNVSFTETNKVIVYRLKFKNFSEFSVLATFNGLKEFAETTTLGFNYDSETLNLPADNSEVVFDIVLSLNNFNKSFNENLSFSINFGQPDLKQFLSFTPEVEGGNEGYYTTTMGEYEGNPLVWKMILKEGENGLENTCSYTAETELSGTYYFTLDTYIPELLMCSYLNNYEYTFSKGFRNIFYEWMALSDIVVDTDDYATSTVRLYLTGNDVYRSAKEQTLSGYDYFYMPAKYGNQVNPDNFLDLFNIESSPLYSLITPRTLADLYESIGVEYSSDVEEHIPSSTADKLWLISLTEANKALKNDSSVQTFAWRPNKHGISTISWEEIYWTRGGTFRMDGNSTASDALTSSYESYAVRPCFKIVIE